MTTRSEIKPKGCGPRRRARGTHHIRALTLLELLAVIAIIAILASLLLAALTTAKSQARSAVCRSNLRQIGLAMTMYLGDYSEYPRGTGGGDWQRLLSAYSLDVIREAAAYDQRGRYRNPLFRNRFWICPELEPGSASGDGLIYDDVLKVNILEKENVVSVYGINDYGTMPMGRTLMGLWDRNRGAKEGDVKVPSHMVAVGHLRLVGFERVGPIERADHRGDEIIRDGDDIVQGAQDPHVLRPQPGFLPRLAQRRRDDVGVALLRSAAGEGDLAAVVVVFEF